MARAGVDLVTEEEEEGNLEQLSYQQRLAKQFDADLHQMGVASKVYYS
jgi:hypothetical protein